jgi:hypothetical protein
MSKVNEQMITAIGAKAPWTNLGNTAVEYINAGNPNGPRSEIRVLVSEKFEIMAEYWHDLKELHILHHDFMVESNYPMSIVKNRLNALAKHGYNVCRNIHSPSSMKIC